MKAAIVGVAGTALSADELALFAAMPPAGVILFGRNVESPAQLVRLTGDLHEVLPPGARVLVDQEGGRVARLRGPGWSVQPAAGLVGALHDADPAAGMRLAWLTGAIIGVECREAGFDVVCAPVLDLLRADTTDAIGDRAYGSEPGVVAALAQAMADGLLAGGVEPVGKHAPGHGRATVDSHLELPFVAAGVDVRADVGVFRRCHGLPWMMTAHVLFADLDPARPASLSARVIERVIRGEIGFDGVLVSDDLAMGALEGAPGERAAAALAAGSDLALHCSGRIGESEAVLEAMPLVSEAALRRLARAAALVDRSRMQLERHVLLRDQAALLEAFVAG